MPEPGGPPPPLLFLGPGDSTLDAAWRLTKANPWPPFGSLLMESQTAGRGRGGQPWLSPAGHIYAALLLPPAPPFDGPGAALALAWFVAEALEEMGWPLAVKWPNDLIFQGGKTGGILLEARRGQVMAGLGLNLGSPPPGVEREPGRPPATALPGAPPPHILWPALVKNIILRYNAKIGSWLMTETAAAAERRLWRRGRRVLISRPAAEPPVAGNAGMAGRLVGLGPEGQALLEEGGLVSQVWSGTLILDEPNDF